jgi:hypothetical protein
MTRLIRRAFRSSHASEVALVELAAGAKGGRADEARGHLASCATCRQRHAELVRWLDDVRAAGIAEADAVFDAARLLAQRERIVDRLERLDQPARILTFPVRGRPAVRFVRPARRWVTAAAIGGLLAGFLGGQWLDVRHNPTIAGKPRLGSLPWTDSQPALPGQSAPPLGEDDFLESVELALSRAGIAELEAIDELTPRVREISLNIR